MCNATMVLKAMERTDECGAKNKRLHMHIFSPTKLLCSRSRSMQSRPVIEPCTKTIEMQSNLSMRNENAWVCRLQRQIVQSSSHQLIVPADCAKFVISTDCSSKSFKVRVPVPPLLVYCLLSHDQQEVWLVQELRVTHLSQALFSFTARHLSQTLLMPKANLDSETAGRKQLNRKKI